MEWPHQPIYLTGHVFNCKTIAVTCSGLSQILVSGMCQVIIDNNDSSMQTRWLIYLFIRPFRTLNELHSIFHIFSQTMLPYTNLILH